MQGRYGPAIAHVQSGIKILDEIEYDEKSDSHQHVTLRYAAMPHVPMPILLEIFMRLDYQITDVRATWPHTVYMNKLTVSPDDWWP
jgi:hypothetical protein